MDTYTSSINFIQIITSKIEVTKKKKKNIKNE